MKLVLNGSSEEGASVAMSIVFRAASAACIAAAFAAAEAQAITLFELDFENAAYNLSAGGNGQRTVASIKTQVGVCPGDPICGATTQFPAHPNPPLTNEATDAAINVRKATNDINTETAAGFDGFFTSRFLVIGDNSGDIGGEPNGQPDSFATSQITFALPDLGTHTVRLSYDFVFDTNNNSNGDDWPPNWMRSSATSRSSSSARRTATALAPAAISPSISFPRLACIRSSSAWSS
jgi:hypothetical protein